MVRLRPVDMAETARYLGYGDKTPDPVITNMLKECEAPLLAACRPAYSIGIFDCTAASEGEIELSECAMKLTGRDIVMHLAGCEKVALVAATLGADVDSLIRRLQVTDMPKALLTDAMAGTVIEQILDDIQGELQENLPEYTQTARFSPGYGDLPLALQSEFLAVTEAGKRIGLCVTQSGLLTPLKSVTAIVGFRKMRNETDGTVTLTLPQSGCQTGAGCAGCAYSASCASKKQ